MVCNQEYITAEAFVKMAAVNREKDKVCKWIDLPVNVIYQINGFQECFSRTYDSPCWCWSLQDCNCSFKKVWGPKKLITDIKER